MQIEIDRLHLVPLPDSPWLVLPSPCQGAGFGLYLGLSTVVLLAVQRHPEALMILGGICLGIGTLFAAAHQARASVQYCPDCLRSMPRTAHACVCGRTDGQQG